MTQLNLDQLKYPIGKFVISDRVSDAEIKTWISDIERLPQSLESIVENLYLEELSLPYRPGGWTIKQVIHHLSDSHMNAIIRFKLSLTEDSPVIKPYMEDQWATLEDGMSDDITDSLGLLKHLHAKWVKLLQALTEEDLKRSYIHPEHGKRFLLSEAMGMYAWHGNHHLAHVKQALEYKGSF